MPTGNERPLLTAVSDAGVMISKAQDSQPSAVSDLHEEILRHVRSTLGYEIPPLASDLPPSSSLPSALLTAVSMPAMSSRSQQSLDGVNLPGGRPAGGFRAGVSGNNLPAVPQPAVPACELLKRVPANVLFNATALCVRERLLAQMKATEEECERVGAKKVCYLSLEFLVGRSLQLAVACLSAQQAYKDALLYLGCTLEVLEQHERDPALGNGGLGRLASCFLDSLSALSLPAWGYGIRYRYGMFEQRIVGQQQQENPDAWLQPFGCPWEVKRPSVRYTVRFYGQVVVTAQGARTSYQWQGGEVVEAVAYDIPVPGFRSKMTNRMRLWGCEASSGGFDLSLFNAGQHASAMSSHVRAEAVSSVLYPDDATEQGKELRLQQEFFFVSATLQDIIARHKAAGRHLLDLPAHAAVQLNDTHPALAVPETMRLLLDEHGLEWDDAWNITLRLLSYTNHTILPEALEKWSVPLLQHVLPRPMALIFEINHRHLQAVESRCLPDSTPQLSQLSIIEESNPKMARMAVLATVGSHAINGVAELHTSLIRSQLLPDFAMLFPERFHSKTNGVSQRRWLLLANPSLSQVITKWLGTDTWASDFGLVQGLRAFASSPQLHVDWAAARAACKQKLAAFIQRTCGLKVDCNALFDIQAKRIHEYKRQLLNILSVIHRYNVIKASTPEERQLIVPRVIIFAGKAAPGYVQAKRIIHLINAVADRVNSDADVAGLLTVVFIPNYSVSIAQLLIPASDLSQHISTAGMEASGTSNMKFAMNGGLLLATFDGATIEIGNSIGRDNIFAFGALPEETAGLRRALTHRCPVLDERLTHVIQTIESGTFGSADSFRPLLDAVSGTKDFFLVAHDWPSYLDAQHSVDALYVRPTDWWRKSVISTSMMARFSSDRTVAEYARDIWDLKQVRIPRE